MTITIHDLQAWKSEGQRFTMLTAYDYPTARILDEAGVPVLLVGDSVGRNVLGYANELPVTMDEMVHHVKAVARGAEHAMVVGDLPFMSYQASLADGVRNAGRLIWASTGTSFGAAATSGLAALLVDEIGKNRPDEVVEALFASADDRDSLGVVGDARYYGHGRINVAKAVGASD